MPLDDAFYAGLHPGIAGFVRKFAAEFDQPAGRRGAWRFEASGQETETIHEALLAALDRLCTELDALPLMRCVEGTPARYRVWISWWTYPFLVDPDVAPPAWEQGNG